MRKEETEIDEELVGGQNKRGTARVERRFKAALCRLAEAVNLVKDVVVVAAFV